MLPSLVDHGFMSSFFKDFDDIFISKRHWYDPEKYDLVLKKDYIDNRIKALKDYKDTLKERIKKVDDEIDKLGSD